MELYIYAYFYAYFPMYYGFTGMLTNITVNHVNTKEKIVPRAKKILDKMPRKERRKFLRVRRIKMISASIGYLLNLTAVINQMLGYEVEYTRNLEIFAGVVFLIASYAGLYYPKIVKKYIESIPGN